MGDVIHMETEEVRSVAQKLDYTSDEIHQMVASLGSILRALNWQGGGRDAFIGNFQSLERQIKAEADRGVVLSMRVKREVDEWLEADRSYREQKFGSAGPEQPLPSPTTPDEEGKPYKWYKIPKAVLKFAKLVITNNEIKKKIPILGWIIGSGEDLIEGDNPLHAISSEGIETLINLTPPMAIYGLFLAGGQLVSAGFEAFGSHQTAVNIQGFVGKADIVDHVGDAIADFYIKHPEFLLKGNNPVGMALSPEVQEFAFGFWSQELQTWGFHDQAEWMQNTGNIVVDKMKEYHPKNVFNNYFGLN